MCVVRSGLNKDEELLLATRLSEISNTEKINSQALMRIACSDRKRNRRLSTNSTLLVRYIHDMHVLCNDILVVCMVILILTYVHTIVI